MKAILLVDDVHQGLAGLAAALADAGYDAVLVPESDDAVTRFTLAQAELVFISTEGRDPEIVCEGIRSEPDGAIVPIVLVGSPRDGLKSAADALAKGADFFFEQPIDAQRVLAKVQTYIGPGDPTPKRPDAAAPKAPGLNAAELFDDEATAVPGEPKPSRPARPLDDEATTPGSAAPKAAGGLPAPPRFDDWPVAASAAPRTPTLAGPADALLALVDAPNEAGAENSWESSSQSDDVDEIARRVAFEDSDDDAEVAVAHRQEAKVADEVESAEAMRLRVEREVREKLEREEEERRALEEELRREREEANRRERQEREQREREAQAQREAEQRAREEAELRAREEAERRAKEAAERRIREEAERKAREELERKAREEAERRAKEAAERRVREEAERKAREEAERRAKEEAERRIREEAERKAREEIERKTREEAERRLAEEAERRAREEAERQARPEEERLVKEEAARRAQQEAERRAQEEAEQRARAEAEQKALEAEVRRKVEAELRQRRGMEVKPEAAPSRGHDRVAPATRALVDLPLLPLRPLSPQEGTFDATRDIAAVLADIAAQEVTGRVDFSSENRQKSIFFERGRPVDAYSSQVYDRMEEYLLREGKITRAQYQDVRVKALRGPRRIGAHLVAEGALKPHELFEVVRGHLCDMFFGVFEWETGSFRFLPERADEDDKVALEQHPQALIAEGIRRKYLLPRLMRALGGPSSLLRLTAEPAALEAVELTVEERHVVRLVDGTRNIEDLVFSTGMDALRVFHVLAALVTLGHAEIAVRGIEAAHDGSTTGDPIDKNRIRDKIEQVRNLDYFQILGVQRTATPYEIERAFERTLAEFSPQRFSAPLRSELKNDLSEIQQVLLDARQVLKDEALREAYARHLR